MKATIKTVTFKKERDTQFGKMYNFEVTYNDKKAIYSSKYKDQRSFVAGQEAEFTEEQRDHTGTDGNTFTYTIIKPIKQQRQSNFGKALTREQSRYSGFAMSYAKDLVVGGRIQLDDMLMWTEIMFGKMVELAKSLEQ